MRYWRDETTSHLNALIAQDREGLVAAAAAMDRAGGAREAGRPLAGVPIALKDNIDTATLPADVPEPFRAGGRCAMRRLRRHSSMPARCCAARPTCMNSPSASPVAMPDRRAFGGRAAGDLAHMIRLLQKRRAEGATFVIVEQNLNFLMAIMQQVLVLDHGECVLSA